MLRRTSKTTFVVFVCLFILAAACSVQATEPDGIPLASETPQSAGSGPAPVSVQPIANSCGAGPVLTHSPMEDGTFTAITPLGNLAPPSHTFPTGHMYFGLPFEQTGGTDGPFGNGMIFPPQKVYAAADARVASLAVSNVISTQSGEAEHYQEFSLRLKACNGMLISYGHIGPLSERLQTLVDQAEPNWCNSYSTGAWEIDSCEYSVDWSVHSGELIAYTSGRAAAFDFGASLDSASGSHKRIATCPLDLYGDELRLMFEKLLGDGQITRTAEPVCGTVYQEIPGTAQGRWYKTLDGHPIEDQNIALVHDNFDPAIPVFSIGNSLPGLQSNAYRFVPGSSGAVNRDFSDMAVGSGVYCYEGLSDRRGSTLDGTALLVEMPDETTLRIEAVQLASCGAGPWNLSSTASTYFR